MRITWGGAHTLIIGTEAEALGGIPEDTAEARGEKDIKPRGEARAPEVTKITAKTRKEVDTAKHTAGAKVEVMKDRKEKSDKNKIKN
jgi:hypothetical protein